MGKPVMAAEAERVKASIKQVIGKLMGDRVIEGQGKEESSKKELGKVDDPSLAFDKAST